MNNCCIGWNITWKKDEIEKLKSADASEELRTLIDKSFVPYESQFVIVVGNDKRCPFLTEDNFCRIQREVGAEYLSHTCMTYPRYGRMCGNAYLRTADLSCENVVHTLCNNENCMEIEKKAYRKQKNTYSEKDDGEVSGHKVFEKTFFFQFNRKDIIKHPEVLFDEEIFLFFYELIQDTRFSVETALTFGAMAAQKMDQFIAAGKQKMLPEVMKACKKQFDNPAQIEKLENARPNLSLKANFIAGIMQNIGKGYLYGIFENGVPSEERYNEGLEEFNKVFGDRPFMFRNLVLNLYISMGMPFRMIDLTLFESFSIFAAEAAILKLLMPNIPLSYTNTEEAFEYFVSFVDRSFTHSIEKNRSTLEFMKSINCTSPAYLLGLLK